MGVRYLCGICHPADRGLDGNAEKSTGNVIDSFFSSVSEHFLESLRAQQAFCQVLFGFAVFVFETSVICVESWLEERKRDFVRVLMEQEGVPFWWSLLTDCIFPSLPLQSGKGIYICQKCIHKYIVYATCPVS